MLEGNPPSASREQAFGDGTLSWHQGYADPLEVRPSADPLPRPEVVSKMWDYIKRNNLQNPQNKREIKADSKLEKVFGKKSVTMFEMNKHLAQHLT
jgi:SWIB/MDM2 domain-containing protein